MRTGLSSILAFALADAVKQCRSLLTISAHSLSPRSAFAAVGSAITPDGE
jgi:hypothetical protein